MNRIITLAVLFTALTTCLHAKPKENVPFVNELSLSYSLAGISISDYSSAALWSALLTDGRVLKDVSGPGLLEYYHSFSRVFSLGACLSFGKADGFSIIDSGTFSSWNIALAPSVRFTWFQHPIIKPYSRIALGLGILNYRENDSAPKRMLTPELQIAPIGILVGKRRFRWIMEMGWGSYGWCLTGLNYCF